ncbi:b(o/a)3-type cytochrome-c oxidase subunit 1 [Thermicanus aegyptius]|uniref:b(o/a)3-type cytochrome-c oxidase subunit 1 n=1 Tax=Thermicanus aegyptius TaxID=94009 RepID=UPI000425C48C|nr:b(o/a)3-type cytochrome-c oxidase subunit 1 [Thermicanus aegyptius]
MSQAHPGYDGAVLHDAKAEFDAKDKAMIKAHLAFAYISLGLGAIAGLLQALERTGMVISLPLGTGYYQLLTLHGVLLGLVFTTLFIIGFLHSGIVKTLGGAYSNAERRVAWVGFYMMLIGVIMAGLMILTNQATVLYTFYAPLHASPWFYIGSALLIVGSWVSGVAIFMSYGRWKKANPGKPAPLFSFMSVATMILWIIATLGVAVEVLFQLIPWSFGWVPRIDVELSRTFFWYFGHPLVYFWLLPAYIYWYVNIPRIIKGKIFSDSLPRLTFILFILYSIPVGFHHQLMEPGIGYFWKFLQVILTFFVVIPSLLTAFTILATFELAGRSLGAKGRFGWVRKMPWGDVRFLAPVVGMLFFIPGGAGGIINASYQMNQVVHNTLWVTGHFHMTLATTVILTFFGISYWLIPALTNRILTPVANRLGILQTVIWSLGMLLMSVPMHITGILGEPRRTAYTTYGNAPLAEIWRPYRAMMAMGGTLLFIGIVIFLGIAIYLWYFAPKAAQSIEYPIGEVNDKAPAPPPILERWSLWVAITFALVLIAYTVPIVGMFMNPSPGSPPLRTW